MEHAKEFPVKMFQNESYQNQTNTEQQMIYTSTELPGHFEYEVITPDPMQGFQPENAQHCQEDEYSVMDLRTTKIISGNYLSSREYSQLNAHQEENTDNTPMMEHYYQNDSFIVSNASKSLEFIAVNQICYEECSGPNHPLDYVDRSSYGENSLYIGQSLWDIGTNTDPVVIVDQGTQTSKTLTKDMSVQTERLSSPFRRSCLQNYRKRTETYSCIQCQRQYSTKSSYERHLRTHNKIGYRKILTNIQLNGEAKVEIYEQKFHRQSQTADPVIIQVPQTVDLGFQCKQCKKSFHTAKERYEHLDYCIVKPFPMTKCPECNIKFYTTGCLNEHISRIHKKEMAPINSYYCIFCDKSFDACYTFHLHLSDHLSP